MSSFKKADLILKSKPFVYVLNNSERGKRCDFCFERGESLKRCSQCMFVYFCNKECQSQAWVNHRDECKSIKKAHPKQPTPSLRLLALLILKLKKFGNKAASETIGEHSRCFHDLESHVEEVKSDQRTCQQMVAFIGTLNEYIGTDNIPQMTEFIEIFGKMVINTFSIWDPQMESIGSGLYLGASIFNHSCEPNAEVVFVGTTLYVRAISDIPGANLQNVYISYIDQMQRTSERRKQLEEQYYFVCECQRCSNSDNEELMNQLLDESVAVVEKEEHLKEVVEKLKDMRKKKESPSSILKLAMDELSMFDPILGSTNIHRIKMLEQVFDSSIQLSQWAEAIATGLELVHPYRLFYGKYHPHYCILLMKIAKIQLLLHQNKEAEKHFIMAEESTRISHGTSHPLYQNLHQMLTQCQSELNSA